MSDQNNHLKELGNSKYEIVTGESDIRGWIVKNEYGRILGKVADLILDTKAEKVKYFVLDTETNELYLVGRKILLPLEYAELDEVYKNVLFKGLAANELSSLPTYDRSTLNARAEELIFHTFKNFKRENHTSAPAAPIASATAVPASGTITADKYRYEDDRIKRQSVAGVFQTREDAETAVYHLIENGFDKVNIHISLRDEEEIERGDIHEREGISDLFSNLFSSDESQWLNSAEARTFPVVAVNRLSIAEAERAAEIMDRNGAVNLDEGIRNIRSSESTVAADRRFRSRIIENK